jgi:hypothetical protein
LSEFLLNPVFPFCTHNFLDPLPQNELCYSTVLHLMVTNGKKDEVITVIDKNKISRDQINARIITKEECKDYKIVFDKRVIVDNYNTKPYVEINAQSIFVIECYPAYFTYCLNSC